MAQNEKLNRRRKIKADRMQIKKLRIERDQLEAVNTKEIELNQQKFGKQVQEMERVVSKELERDIASLTEPGSSNKEQALVLINEVHDDLTHRKLKLLMSKQFYDLTKYLGTLQSTVGMERIIRSKEIEQRHERAREEAQAAVPADKLEEHLDKLGAQMDLELQLMDEELAKVQQIKEAELRQSKEHAFYAERKHMNEKAAEQKKDAIRAAMARFPEDKVVQEVGRKMLSRIDATVEEEITYLEKERDEALEKARMKVIAENEDELKVLQENLNQAVAAEERKIDQ